VSDSNQESNKPVPESVAKAVKPSDEKKPLLAAQEEKKESKPET